MNSRIFTGKIHHTRFLPRRYTFSYPSAFFGFDLDELPNLHRHSRLFRHNTAGILSVWDRDYLQPGDAALKDKLSALLREWNIALDGWTRTLLVTNPRYLGYIFNPVSFFLCFSEQGALLGGVANVNNTFGESHVYPLIEGPSENPDRSAPLRCTRCKDFHVSPFFEVRGRYSFLVDLTPDSVDIDITMDHEATKEFQAHLTGEGVPFSHEELLRMLRRYPLNAVLAFPRIVYQAKRLWWNEGLPWKTRPAPQSVLTLRKGAPGPAERAGLAVTRALLRNITTGYVELTLPNGERLFGGDPAAAVRCSVAVHDYRLFKNLLFQGEIGFCESYVAKDFDCSDTLALFEIIIANSALMENRWLSSSRWLRPFAGALHRLRRNTRSQSERNIHVHYDIGNEFYRDFLDDQMVYSAAVYDPPESTLEIAQQRKIDCLLDRAGVQLEHHVLEIGCGWGALAVAAAKRFGCRVTGVTLSREQYEFARARVLREGLEELVEIRYVDYRDIKGTFDRIVSCEMIEAVGQDFLPGFFAQCHRLLRPGGTLTLQAITMNEQRYSGYCHSVDWIQYAIFPGGHLPAVSALLKAAAGFQLDSAWEFGRDYARTLRDWRARLMSHPERREAAERPLTLERRWMLYLQYCEAAFHSRHIGTHHLVFSKAAV